MTTCFHDAPSHVAVAEKTLVCTCPCGYAGHTSVCVVAIKPKTEYRVALLYGERRQPAAICIPCWTAIHGEPCERSA